VCDVLAIRTVHSMYLAIDANLNHLFFTVPFPS